MTATDRITAVLEGWARRGTPGAYSTLREALPLDDFQPYDTRLWQELDRVSTASDLKNGTLLSVLVVHKDGDYRPGEGFFAMAQRHGRDVSDIDACWVQEFQRVLGVYATGRRR